MLEAISSKVFPIAFPAAISASVAALIKFAPDVETIVPAEIVGPTADVNFHIPPKAQPICVEVSDEFFSVIAIPAKTSPEPLLAVAVLVAMALGYIGEIIFGYPVNLLGIVFSAGAPIQAVWFAGIGALLLKIKFGLVKIDQIFPALKASAESQ